MTNPLQAGRVAFERMRDDNGGTGTWQELSEAEKVRWESDATERPHLYGLPAKSPVSPLQAGVDPRAVILEWLDMAEKLQPQQKHLTLRYPPICASELAAIRALAEAPVLPDRGWRPIESAPRDGTNIIAYDDGATTVVFYDDERNDWFYPYKGGKTRWNTVTHWMPLPDAPAEGAES